ncbi:hypothetical protein [Rhizobium sp. Root708]|nr:hypothetical protein [Rhizobium sp. Root708]
MRSQLDELVLELGINLGQCDHYFFAARDLAQARRSAIEPVNSISTF